MSAEQFINRLNDVRTRYKLVANATDGVFTIKLISEMPNAMGSVKTHYEFLMCDERVLMCCEKEEANRHHWKVAARATHTAMVSQESSCFNCNRAGHFCYECPKQLKESLRSG